MIVYCVTKNAPDRIVYLGTSIEKAEESVGRFSKYQRSERQFPVNFRSSYTLLPAELDAEMIQFYATDGWWYSIVMFELKETNNGS